MPTLYPTGIATTGVSFTLANTEKEVLGLTIDTIVPNKSVTLVASLGVRVSSPRNASLPDQIPSLAGHNLNQSTPAGHNENIHYLLSSSLCSCSFPSRCGNSTEGTSCKDRELSNLSIQAISCSKTSKRVSFGSTRRGATTPCVDFTKYDSNSIVALMAASVVLGFPCLRYLFVIQLRQIPL